MTDKQIRKLIKSVLKSKYSEDDLIYTVKNSYWLNAYDYQKDPRKSFMRKDEIIKTELVHQLSTRLNI